MWWKTQTTGYSGGNFDYLTPGRRFGPARGVSTYYARTEGTSGIYPREMHPPISRAIASGVANAFAPMTFVTHSTTGVTTLTFDMSGVISVGGTSAPLSDVTSVYY